MADDTVGCGRVTGTAEEAVLSGTQEPALSGESLQEVHMSVGVGQQAPDFTARAYQGGGFSPVSLSDFAGKWVLLCFYPGDFTFV